jgi:hypothetical protein
MASLAQIRDGIAKTIKNHCGVSSLSTYKYVEEVATAPCIMVEPWAADFEGNFARGLHTWDFNIYVIVSPSASSAVGQALLDRLCDGGGDGSIQKIIDEHPNLGLTENTQAICYMLKGYGGHYEWAKIPHVGAVLKVRVITDPRD